MTEAVRRGVRRSGAIALREADLESGRWAKLNVDLAKCDPQDVHSLRDAVAAVYEAIAVTPEPLLQDFSTFKEAVLADGAEARAGLVLRGTVTVTIDAAPRSTLLDAFKLLRALEANLAELGRYMESDQGEDLEAAWRTTDGRHYVIPRLTALALIDGKPFLRRALRHHRVLPTSVDGFRVRLHRSCLALDSGSAQHDRQSSSRRYGAAWFPGLKIEKVSTGEDLFLVQGLEGFDAPALLDTHLDSAKADECRAIVWGELTMPEVSVARVSDRLAETAFDGVSPLQYIVAGSWHREAGGGMRNVAQILDGLGEPLFEIFKWAKFNIGSEVEAIVAGDEAHILIAEDELVLVAICRDFLQQTCDLPYRHLNVDVAIIPSMTSGVPDEATMEGHAATANMLRVRYGTRTLVVAQPAIAAKGPVGEVLAFPAKPLQAGSESVDCAFKVCILETR